MENYMFCLNGVQVMTQEDLSSMHADDLMLLSYQDLDVMHMQYNSEGEDEMSLPAHMGTRRMFKAITFPCYSDPQDGLCRKWFSKNKFKRARTYKKGKPSRVKPAHKR